MNGALCGPASEFRWHGIAFAPLPMAAQTPRGLGAFRLDVGTLLTLTPFLPPSPRTLSPDELIADFFN